MSVCTRTSKSISSRCIHAIFFVASIVCGRGLYDMVRQGTVRPNLIAFCFSKVVFVTWCSRLLIKKKMDQNSVSWLYCEGQTMVLHWTYDYKTT